VATGQSPVSERVAGAVAKVGRLAAVVDHCLEVFVPDRVMFAGDWPVCTRVAGVCDWVGALKWIVAGRSVEQRRTFFHDNAVRVYGLHC
jgi:L-fuconolactonase